jgi:SulP family sulfate permease
VLEKLESLYAAAATAQFSALLVGLGAAALIFVLRRLRPTWPAMLIAVVLATVITAALHLPLETIGTRFGGIPQSLPAPHWPDLSLSRLAMLWPAILSFTLLGGVESLLSAKVADGMTGRKHRYNMELVAQGIANVASALFGGISVTGTIARTATNIRAGARSPLAGMMHSALLLIFMLSAARLANFIPLSALAGVLVVVASNMIEVDGLLALLRNWRSGMVLIVTLGLTLLHDLTVGIVAGCVLSAILALLPAAPTPVRD